MDWLFIERMLAGTFWASHNLLINIPAYLSLVPLVLFIFLPRWKGWAKKLKTKKAQNRVRIFAAVVFVILLSTGLILSAEHLYKNKATTFATPDELIPLNLRDLQIDVVDLARHDLIVRNKTFYNCYLYGPAVITVLGDYVTFEGDYFDAPIDTLFTVIEYRYISWCNRV